MSAVELPRLAQAPTGPPVASIALAAVAVREGAEAWRGEGCCVSSPLDGAGFAEESREDDRCRAGG